MREAISCLRAKSDMTPCVVRDGSSARADDGKGVGCGISVSDEGVPDMVDITEKNKYWSPGSVISDGALYIEG